MEANIIRPLASALGEELQPLKTVRHCADGEVLFHCGQDPRGIYMVESGVVALWLECRKQQPRLLETARTGAVLGLSESLTGGVHKLTARCVGASQIATVPREELVLYLHRNPECCMRVVQLLSEDLHALYGKYCSMDDERLRAGRHAKVGRATALPLQ